MNKPTDLLIRTETLEAGTLALSALTGLSRLSLELHRLTAADRLTSPAGGERFLYVLGGSGSLRVQPAEAEATTELGPGDFVALSPAESAELHTDQNIEFLLGEARNQPVS